MYLKMTPGPRNLITDVPGLRVGNARDDALKSGATVLVGGAPFTASVNVMGGAPARAKPIFWRPTSLWRRLMRYASRAVRLTGWTRVRVSWTGCANKGAGFRWDRR